MSQTFDPTPYLPPRMLEYVKFPWLLLGSWMIIGAGILFAPLPPPTEDSSSAGITESESESGFTNSGDTGSSTNNLSASALAPGDSNSSSPIIRVAGSVDLSLQDTGNGITAESSKLPAGSVLSQNIEGEMTEIRLQAPGRGLVAQAHKKASEKSLTLEDANGTITQKILFTDEGLNVLSASGEKMYRIKVKDDKFNLLDSNGNRLFHGKRSGTIVVKDESGRVVGTVSFSESLSQSEQFLYAAEATLPISVEARALLLEHSMRGIR